MNSRDAIKEYLVDSPDRIGLFVADYKTPPSAKDVLFRADRQSPESPEYVFVKPEWPISQILKGHQSHEFSISESKKYKYLLCNSCKDNVYLWQKR